jgi:hypothetical protein
MQKEKNSSQYLEQGCAGRMTHLQFIGTGNEFATVPEANGGFKSQQVYSKGYSEAEPAQDEVQFSEIHKFRCPLQMHEINVLILLNRNVFKNVVVYLWFTKSE